MALKWRRVVGPSAVTLVVVLLLWRLPPQGVNLTPMASAATGTFGTYTTTFPLSENPTSEGGKWINGGTAGLDWTNCRTTRNFVFGTESGSAAYDDSTCILAGSWGPDQTVQATVSLPGPLACCAPYEEVELRLRTSISAHSLTGYEVTFQASTASNAYIQIVKWGGALGSFAYIGNGRNGPGIHTGDVLKATISGNTITAYVNNTQVLRETDATYSTGSPGVGFYLGGTGSVSGYGFSAFSATDGSVTPPVPPTNLSTIAH